MTIFTHNHNHRNSVKRHGIVYDKFVPKMKVNLLSIGLSLGEAAIFVNSEAVSRTKGKGMLTQDWRGRVQIGSYNGNFPFHGVLDDFVIYTIALEPDTIKKLTCTCSLKQGRIYRKL